MWEHWLSLALVVWVIGFLVAVLGGETPAPRQEPAPEVQQIRRFVDE